MMYKHILVATDGSDIATNAADHAIDLAKQQGSKLTAVMVSEPYEAVAFTGSTGGIDPSDYAKSAAQHAETILSGIAAMATEAGVGCDTVHQASHWPYDGIIKAAEQVGADLIVLGSHGRRGLEGMLLGSQAVKLLTHTKIPTLVIR